MTIQRFAALQGGTLNGCLTLSALAAMLARLSHAQGMAAIKLRVS
jgi:hypothetical protein